MDSFREQAKKESGTNLDETQHETDEMYLDQLAEQNSHQPFNQEVETPIDLKRLLAEGTGLANFEIILSNLTFQEVPVLESLLMLASDSFDLSQEKLPMDRKPSEDEIRESHKWKRLGVYFLEITKNFVNAKKAVNGRTAELMVTSKVISESKHSQSLQRLGQRTPKGPFGLFG